MANYILVDGEPVPEPDIRKWAEWFETADRTVARTGVGEAEVSTVFLGIGHGFGGPPLLYETMVFGGSRHESQWRYATLAEAKSGHDDIVRSLRAELED